MFTVYLSLLLFKKPLRSKSTMSFIGFFLGHIWRKLGGVY